MSNWVRILIFLSSLGSLAHTMEFKKRDKRVWRKLTAAEICQLQKKSIWEPKPSPLYVPLRHYYSLFGDTTIYPLKNCIGDHVNLKEWYRKALKHWYPLVEHDEYMLDALIKFCKIDFLPQELHDKRFSHMANLLEYTELKKLLNREACEHERLLFFEVLHLKKAYVYQLYEFLKRFTCNCLCKDKNQLRIHQYVLGMTLLNNDKDQQRREQAKQFFNYLYQSDPTPFDRTVESKSS